MRILGIDTSARASVAVWDTEEGSVLWQGESPDDTSHAESTAAMVAEAVAAHGTPQAVAVGAGPGPFTGLRVGVATAQTLAFAWDVPVLTIPSLDALAVQQRRLLAGDAEGAFLCAATNARRRELYSAMFLAEAPAVSDSAADTRTRLLGTFGLRPLSASPSERLSAAGPAQVLTPAQTFGEAEHAADELNLRSMLLVGEGFELYRQDAESWISSISEESRSVRISAGSEADQRPQAAVLAEMAGTALGAGLELPHLTPLYLRESDAKLPARPHANPAVRA